MGVEADYPGRSWNICRRLKWLGSYRRRSSRPMHVFDSGLTIWAGHAEALANGEQEEASVNSALE